MLQGKYIFNRAIFGVQERRRFYVGVASCCPCSVCWAKAVISLLTTLSIRKSVFL